MGEPQCWTHLSSRAAGQDLVQHHAMMVSSFPHVIAKASSLLVKTGFLVILSHSKKAGTRWSETVTLRLLARGSTGHSADWQPILDTIAG